MDRFIVRTINNLIAEKFGLKSNMDRFIEFVFDELGNNFSLFKIQYG